MCSCCISCLFLTVVQINVVDTHSSNVPSLTFPEPGGQMLATAKDLGWGDYGNSICLEGDALRKLGQDGLAKVVFATYKNIEQFLHPEGGRPYEGDKRPSWQSGFQGHDPGMDIEVEMHETKEDKQDYYDKKPALEDEAATEPDKKEEQNVTKIVNSQIISASVNGREGEQIPLGNTPIRYTLEHNTVSWGQVSVVATVVKMWGEILPWSKSILKVC